ncbi:hypothetical protein DITRI_Ditri20bG0039500 [Diplodiscus trichospermus]
MKASLLFIVTLLLFEVIDGNGARICYGRDIPLHFHRMHHERMAMQAVQRLKSRGFPWSRIYPPPKANTEARFKPSPPLQQPQSQPPSPPPQLPTPPPPPFYRRGSFDNGGRGNRGGYPKMDP